MVIPPPPPLLLLRERIREDKEQERIKENEKQGRIKDNGNQERIKGNKMQGGDKRSRWFEWNGSLWSAHGGIYAKTNKKDAINVIQCGPGPSHQEVLPRMPLLLLLLGTVVIGAALARSSIKS